MTQAGRGFTSFAAPTLAAFILAMGVTGACSSDEDPGGTGGKAGSGGTGGSRASGGTGGSVATVECGGETCTVPAQAGMLGITACCADVDGGEVCGLLTPLASGCVVGDPNAGLDPSCPDIETPVSTLPGCCRSDGQCGGLNAALGGCAAAADLGGTAQACTYDPNNICTSLLEVPCDGPEDCPSGQRCCGTYGGAGYSRIECLASCAATGDGGPGGTVLEICHPGATCEDSTYTCQTSDIGALPDFLFRCYSQGVDPTTTPPSTAADEVNCGASTCGAGEKCCLREPSDPYCAPMGQDCTCAVPMPDGGGAEAGDGSGDADGSTGDASTD
jgi:hypothetical protein